jgi:branched-chain amino acid transport system ATP-binding protein
MSALLHVEDLYVSYGEFEALHGVSLEVQEGEIVAIVGANGAGKTTTLRALAGLTPPRRGRISYGGQRVDGLPPRELVERGIALIPEGRQLFPQMSVEDNLLVGAEARATGRARANLNRMYERLPLLSERRSQLAGTLSGGEQQMVAIARGLMSEPHVLLLDEPSLGLAPRVMAQVMDLVVRLSRERGLTIVLVEQNARSALAVADHGVVLNLGRVVASADAATLAADVALRHHYLGF